MKHRRSSSEVTRLVSEYQESGLSQRAFAESKGVPMSTVSGWVRRLRKRASSRAQPSSLVPVVSKAAAPRPSVIRVDLPCGRRVEVPWEVPASTLAEILAAVSTR